jgi:hypothetical protein
MTRLLSSYQVEAFDFIDLKLHGSLAFLLWKSVYITKQVCVCTWACVSCRLSGGI